MSVFFTKLFVIGGNRIYALTVRFTNHKTNSLVKSNIIIKKRLKRPVIVKSDVNPPHVCGFFRHFFPE